MKERLRPHLGPGIALVLTAVFAVWHYFETKAGGEATGELWLLDAYLGLGVLAAVILLAFYGLLALKPQKLERCAVFAVMGLGLLYLCVLAPFSAPDEDSHFASAYAISNGFLGEAPVDEEGYVRMRKADEALLNIYGVSGDELRTAVGGTLDQESYVILREGTGSLFAPQPEREMVSSVYSPVKTTPLAYFPQAIGITIARLLGLNGVFLAFCGRFSNLCFYACCLYFAVKKIPFGKELLLGTALLPMALHQVSSYSYDTFVLGLTGVFGASCLYLAFEAETVKWKDTAVMAALMAALGPCKIVYSVIMGFALLIPIKKFGDKKRWALSAALVFFSFGAAMIAVNGDALSLYLGGGEPAAEITVEPAVETTGAAVGESAVETTGAAVDESAAETTETMAATEPETVMETAGNYIDWAGEPGYTLSWLIHNPSRFFRILYETVLHQGDEWVLTMLGSHLGIMDPVLSVPFFALVLLAACLILLSLHRAGEPVYLGPWQKAWILLLSAAGLFGLLMAMLLAWTPISSPIVLGVQGRYLLPFLPFGLMTLKNERLVRVSGSGRRLLFYMAAVDVYAILRLFSIVSMRI